MWLPVNVYTVPHVGGSSTPPGDPRLSLPSGSVLPTLEDMGAWGEAEYELGFDVGEALGFSLERNAGRTLRVLERYHAVEVTSAAGVPLRIGVAVRMVVRWSGGSSSDGPSLSTLAARAEAGGDRAAGTVSVLGFSHLDVGELIPGEVDLDVDGYARLLSAVDGIQSRVADNPERVRPAVIARFEPDSESPPWDSDVTLGAAWGLARMAAGVIRAECPALLTDELKSNQHFAEGLSRAYKAVMGPAVDGPVTSVHAADAKQRLHALNVTGPLTPPRPIPFRPVP
jgi:hypothetical protein